MNKLYITGWALNFAGMALWLYGYMSEGTTSLIQWSSFSPDWVSAFLPNLQAEMGVLLMCFAAVPFFRIAMLQNADRPNTE